MPHLISNRPRRYTKHHYGIGDTCTLLTDWEVFNFLAYLIGGFIFFFGSILFLPDYGEYEWIGAWLFVAGSCLYTAVAFHDLYEVTHTLDEEWHEEHVKKQHHLSAWTWIEWIVSLVYSAAAVIFILGSLLFVPKYENLLVGTWFYIIGSVMYGFGAVVNMAQIYLVQSHLMIQLQMFIAVQFLVGSVLFLCGSCVYLFDIKDGDDAYLFDTYAGALFIAGGTCFTGGAIVNGIRIAHCKSHFGALKKKNDEEKTNLVTQNQESYGATSSDVTN